MSDVRRVRIGMIGCGEISNKATAKGIAAATNARLAALTLSDWEDPFFRLMPSRILYAPTSNEVEAAARRAWAARRPDLQRGLDAALRKRHSER